MPPAAESQSETTGAKTTGAKTTGAKNTGAKPRDHKGSFTIACRAVDNSRNATQHGIPNPALPPRNSCAANMARAFKALKEKDVDVVDHNNTIHTGGQ
jgi:hypothetical protein